MDKYILKIKGSSFGRRRWFLRSVTVEAGVLRYGRIAIPLRDFELVADEDYKKGKYDNYFELREKSLVVKIQKFTSVEQRTRRPLRSGLIELKVSLEKGTPTTWESLLRLTLVRCA